MYTAKFTTPDEQMRSVEVAEGESLMRAAIAAGIDGIIADCGGTASCGTCHVIIGGGYLHLVDPSTPNEEQMLDFTASPREAGSRLSCQIAMTAVLDGIAVRIAEIQV
jgi:2Fe-2S ferredoxin